MDDETLVNKLLNGKRRFTLEQKKRLLKLDQVLDIPYIECRFGDPYQGLCRIVNNSNNNNKKQTIYRIPRLIKGIPSFCKTIVKHGNLPVLKVAIEFGCSHGQYLLAEAVKYGHLHIVRYLEELGYIFFLYHFRLAAKYGHLDILTYMHDKRFTHTTLNGYFQCIKYNRYRDTARWGIYDTVKPALNGRFHCMVDDIEYEWDEKAILYAAAGGFLDCVKFLGNNGYKLEYKVMVEAAKGGYLHIIEYVHEQGCSWNVEVMTIAARGRYFDIVRYLHEHGCPWINEVTTIAAAEGDLAMLQYAVDNGCGWDHDIWSIINITNDKTIRLYAYDHGCKCIV
jgi:hypothetical protein